MRSSLLHSLLVVAVVGLPALGGPAIEAAIHAARFEVTAPQAVRDAGMKTIEINVRDVGAKGDLVADDTAAIQHALDGGRRTVIIPAGRYKISASLQVDSETRIRAAPDAVLQLANGAGVGPEVFLLRNRDRAAGNHDIVVEGGIWDGNGSRNPRGKTPPCYTGVALNFANVQRLVLSGLVVRNPDTFAIRLWRLSDFVVEDIGFDFSIPTSSQDGVHLNGYCERGVIRNLKTLSRFATNDDMVALNADDATGQLPIVRVMCQDVELGPIRHIRIEHLRAEAGYTFVRFLSKEHPIENVIVSDVVGGCRACAINFHNWQFPVGGGNIRNVLLRDFEVWKLPDVLYSSPYLEGVPLLWVRLGVQNLRIENFQRRDDGLTAPTLWLDNERENDTRLEGLIPAQQAGLTAASNGLAAEQFSGTAGSRTLALKSKAGLRLPAGGFSLLEINPGAPASSAVPVPAPVAAPPPTKADVPYGPHARQVLDFWQAPSHQPTPVLFYIHGGGWVAGDKGDPTAQPNLGVDIARYLAAGISIVSIRYRRVQDAMLAGVKYPVEWPMHDAARALQFVRSQAAAWHIDPQRIAVSGASAGACTSLWLAFHEDLADPQSADPVARQSTRPFCAAVQNAQTSLDPAQMKAWTPNSKYGGHAFGFMDPNNLKTRDTRFDEFLAARDRLIEAIREYSPLEHVSADDPPIYLWYDESLGPPALGQEQKNATHSANFGVKLAERLQQVKVPCEIMYSGSPAAPHASMQDFVMDQVSRR